MSKQLWKYLRSRVQVVTNCDKIIKGRVIDFVDEMDNDEQDEITILIANPSPDEATEISLFESEIVSIKTISQDLEQSRCFYLSYLKENTMEKDLVYMAILDDLQELYDNGWDASFDYNGQVCGIFPNSVHDIVVVIGDKEYQVSSFIDLISLKIDDNTLVETMDGIEVQYY